MATMNLRGMDVDALLSLRAEIDKKLSEKRSELEKQLSRLGLESNSGGHAPKFRGPGGETWAGRGARPRWLTALVKEGHKIEEFAINKLSAARKGPAAKKSRRKRK